jgi:hypothetical protein
MIRVDLRRLSSKAHWHAAPTRPTAAAADAAAIIRDDMRLRPGGGGGFPDSDVLVVDHDFRVHSTGAPAVELNLKSVVRALVQGWGSCLIVGSAYHGSTSAKVERASGVVRDSDTPAAARTTRTAPCRSSHRFCHQLEQRGVDSRGRPGALLRRPWHAPRLLLSPPFDDLAAGEPPAHCYAQGMRAMEATERELLAAAQAERRAKLEVGRPP